MRSVYRLLAMLIALGVVVQAAVITWSFFDVLHHTDAGGVISKSTGKNAGQLVHGILGTGVIPTLAIVLLIVSFFARIPGGILWAGITVGVTVLQIGLVFLSQEVPAVGMLHGLNAFALAAVASIAMRKARLAGAPTATPAPAE